MAFAVAQHMLVGHYVLVQWSSGVVTQYNVKELVQQPLADVLAAMSRETASPTKKIEAPKPVVGTFSETILPLIDSYKKCTS